MTRHMIDTMSFHAGCGGALLSNGDGTGYLYCDRCGAFRAGDDEDEGFPTGTDREQNREAYDAGESRSPDAA